jgi:hypothetical protein
MATAYVVETKGGQRFGEPHHRNETKKGWKDSHGAAGCHAPTGKGKSFVLNKDLRSGLRAVQNFCGAPGLPLSLHSQTLLAVPLQLGFSLALRSRFTLLSAHPSAGWGEPESSESIAFENSHLTPISADGGQRFTRSRDRAQRTASETPCGSPKVCPPVKSTA